MTLATRLRSDGPKRILTLDGGGIRGAVTLGFLERIEALLRARHRRPDLRLSDYFDLIGGTSTGAIIAGALAVGREVAEIQQLYLKLGGKVFGRKKWKRWVALYDARPLQAELASVFGAATLGDDAVRTGLCITMKRADTGSTWPLNNHPDGRFYAANKDIPLRHAIRASAAAPVFFVPEKVEIGPGTVGAFVDGGISMANNPALQVLMLATLRGYPFHWPTGEDKLLLVSLGTGAWRRQATVKAVLNGKLWTWASQVPSMLMDDASWQTQLILQCVSNTPTPWEIDEEVGDLAADLVTPEPVLSYLRYNVWLEPESLAALGLPELVPKLASLRQMSAAERRYDLARIGQEAAKGAVRAEHFPHAFDLPAAPQPVPT